MLLRHLSYLKEYPHQLPQQKNTKWASIAVENPRVCDKSLAIIIILAHHSGLNEKCKKAGPKGPLTNTHHLP